MASTSGSNANTGVVVWEWLDDSGHWMNYEPRASDYIEDTHNAYIMSPYMSPVISLDKVLYANTFVDINDMTYVISPCTSIKTAQPQPIRRSIYARDSPIGQGIIWQWKDDLGQWRSYDVSIIDHLEKAKSVGVSIVDLYPCRMPYYIDFSCMMQVRSDTGFRRKIQRIGNSWRYTKTAPLPSSFSTSSASYSMQPVATSLQKSQLTNGYHFPHTSGIPPMSFPPLLMPYAVSTGNGIGSSSSIVPNFPHNAMFSSNSLTSAGTPSKRLRTTRQSVNAAKCIVPSVSCVCTQQQSCSSNNNTTTHSNVKSGARSRSSSSQAKKKIKVEQNFTSSGQGATYIDLLLKDFVIIVKEPPTGEDCCICCDDLHNKSSYSSSSSSDVDAAVQLDKCKHMFHRPCLQAMYDSGTKDGSLQCPNCKTIYGTKRGNCPPGHMEHSIVPAPLPGYEDCNTIRITYMISPGVQGPEHPNPGRSYNARGFPRYGYLPDNDMGRKVLKLLITAWERRLTFTIGTSVTTGEMDTVVWNEIHHKTEIQDIHGHGYPDPNYLENIMAELASQGVTDQT